MEMLKSTVVNDTESTIRDSPNGLALQPRKRLEMEMLKSTVVNDTESVIRDSPNWLALQPRKRLEIDWLFNDLSGGLFLFDTSEGALHLTADVIEAAEEIRIIETPNNEIDFRISKFRAQHIDLPPLPIALPNALQRDYQNLQRKYQRLQRNSQHPFELTKKDGSLKIRLAEQLGMSIEKLSRKTNVFHSQCNNLVRSSLKGIEEVKQRYILRSKDEKLMRTLYTSKKLSLLLSSLNSLLRDLISAEKLLQDCCGEKWKRDAIVLSTPPPELRNYSGSRFFFLIRDLNWSLDMIQYSLQFPEAPQSSTATDYTLDSEELIKVKSSGLPRDQYREEWKFDWSERRCRYRLRRIVHASERKVESHEGDGHHQASDCKDEIREPVIATDGARSCEDDVDQQASDCKDESGVAGDIEESLEGDFDRQAHDRKDLLDNIDKILSTHTHGSSIPRLRAWQLLFGTDEYSRNKFLAVVKNRCQDTSGSGSPNLVSIDHLDVKLKNTLARGPDSSIHKANWLEQEVAVAVVEGFPRAVVEKEAAFMVKLHHPNVVDCFGVAFMKEDVTEEEKNAVEKIESQWTGYLVMELMQEDLRSLIDKLLRDPRTQGSGGPFPLPVTIDILLQIVAALIHVQKFGVIHRDLKARNFLVNPKPSSKSESRSFPGITFYTVKLTDFGESRWGIEDGILTPKRGTVRWMAPEVWESSKYTGSADVYSFGTTCYEIVTGLLPFQGISGRRVMEKVLEGERPTIPGTCPQSLSDLMKKCWAPVPWERPTFEAIQKELWGIKFSVDVQI